MAAAVMLRCANVQGTPQSGIVEIVGSSFYGNFAEYTGGAIYMESVGAALLDVMMESNACAPLRGIGGALASAPRSQCLQLKQHFLPRRIEVNDRTLGRAPYYKILDTTHY